MALGAKYKVVCMCFASIARGDHFIRLGHHGILYHPNDAPVEASIRRLTVAWDATSVFSIYLVVLAGVLHYYRLTPVLTSRQRWMWREWRVGIGRRGRWRLFPWNALLRLIINDRSGGH